jgi:outer membrane protein assembly factor BamB
MVRLYFRAIRSLPRIKAIARHSLTFAALAMLAATPAFAGNDASGPIALSGLEGPPLVIDDVGGEPMMFFTSAAPDMVRALDLTDPGRPKQAWTFIRGSTDRSTAPVCCSTVSRSVVYGQGEIVAATLDGCLVALDALTGRELWTVSYKGPGEGEGAIPTLGIGADKLIASFTDRLVAYDLKSGALSWRQYRSAYTARSTQWSGYDPQLRLLYSLSVGSEAAGSTAIVARKIDTGETRWSYQTAPNFARDDGNVREDVLLDMIVDGKPRRSLVHFDRTGSVYVLDRSDGALLRVTRFVKDTQPLKSRFNSDACAAAMDAQQQQSCAVNPAEPSRFYCPVNHWCGDTRGSPVYVFSSSYLYPQSTEVAGSLRQFDVLTGKSDWEIADASPTWGGAVLASDGLVFYGSLGGDYRAVDHKTGRVVWQRPLGNTVFGDSILYTVKGRQYISLWSRVARWLRLPDSSGLDLGGQYGALGSTAMTAAAQPGANSQSGSLYTFSLRGGTPTEPAQEEIR